MVVWRSLSNDRLLPVERDAPSLLGRDQVVGVLGAAPRRRRRSPRLPAAPPHSVRRPADGRTRSAGTPCRDPWRRRSSAPAEPGQGWEGPGALVRSSNPPMWRPYADPGFGQPESRSVPVPTDPSEVGEKSSTPRGAPNEFAAGRGRSVQYRSVRPKPSATTASRLASGQIGQPGPNHRQVDPQRQAGRCNAPATAAKAPRGRRRRNRRSVALGQSKSSSRACSTAVRRVVTSNLR